MIVVFAARTKQWEFIRQKVGSTFLISLGYLSNSGNRQITQRVNINKEITNLLESGETQITAPLSPLPRNIQSISPTEALSLTRPSSLGSKTLVEEPIA